MDDLLEEAQAQAAAVVRDLRDDLSMRRFQELQKPLAFMLVQ